MTILRIIVVLLFSALIATAQPRVDIRDTTLSRGKVSLVPVEASLSASKNDTVRFIFSYRKSLLNLLLTPTILSTEVTSASISEVPLSEDNSLVTVSFVASNNVTYVGKKVISIPFEPLAGPDSIAKILITRLLIGNRLVDTFKNDSSLIKIYDTAPIEPMDGEYISSPVPNYCTSFTTVEYRVLDSTSVVFDMFNLAGVLVQTDEVKIQPPGIYKHTFLFDTWSVASGVYHIRMKSKRGVYIQQCWVVK
ncbi:MAG: hypothetical protein JNJ85_02200 [Candidatus Kapabacteria bacterium]|nr:hypothetical protein [Candidatus Kapabacteria bacterium]